MGLLSKIKGKCSWDAAVKTVAKMAVALPGLDQKFHIKERLQGPWPRGPFLWLHGASLGECRMLLNLAKALKEDLPKCPPLLITSQKVEVASFLKEAGAGIVEVVIAPADVPSTMADFATSVEPLGLILAENELWPGYLSSMARLSLAKSIVLVSGRYQRSLPNLDFSGMAFACMQTTADLGRFSRRTRGCVPSLVGGDWKLLDWVRNGGKIYAPQNPSVDVAFLSFHVEEGESLLSMLRVSVEQGDAVVLMPRRLSEVGAFYRMLREQELQVVDWPVVKKGAVSVVSCFGVTSELLAISESAVVGGSFARGLGVHNFWEPLLMGVATCVGPYAKGQLETVDRLVYEGVLCQIKSPAHYVCRYKPPVELVEKFLSSEKKKVENSYQVLLKYLKGLLS